MKKKKFFLIYPFFTKLRLLEIMQNFYVNLCCNNFVNEYIMISFLFNKVSLQYYYYFHVKIMTSNVFLLLEIK